MQFFRRVLHHHPRLVSAVLAGIVFGLFAQQLQPLVRVLSAWNVTVWLYLGLTGALMMRASPEKVRMLAEQEDQSALVILVIMSLASIFSIAAIVLELATVKGLPLNARLVHYVFTGASVFGSWLLVATLFTFHYAHLYYRSPVAHRALGFPDKVEYPDYWDFLYFSFTIAVAAQTSDVSIMSRAMRKTVLAQSVLSFLFNAAILGFTINIAASLVGV